MKKLLPLALSLTLLGCKTNQDLTGTYTCVEPSKLKVSIGQLMGVSYSVGTKMTFNKDSTFVYETCAMRLRGNWTVKGDTLLMYYNDRKFKIEEFNSDPQYANAIRISPVPDKIIINGNRLTQKRIAKHSGETIIYQLKKND